MSIWQFYERYLESKTSGSFVRFGPAFVAISFVKVIAFQISVIARRNDEAISFVEFGKKVFPLQSGLDGKGCVNIKDCKVNKVYVVNR